MCADDPIPPTKEKEQKKGKEKRLSRSGAKPTPIIPLSTTLTIPIPFLLPNLFRRIKRPRHRSRRPLAPILRARRLVPLTLSNPLPAVRTSIVFEQPGLDALVVKPVLTWQHGDFLAHADIVHADTALGRVFGAQHILRHLLARESFNVGLRGGPGGVGAGGLLHELGDDSVETFLRVDKVAHLAISGWEDTHGGEELEERVDWHLGGFGVVEGATERVGMDTTWGCSKGGHETSHDVCDIVNGLYP